MSIFEIATMIMLTIDVFAHIVEIWYRLKRVEMEKVKLKKRS